MSGALLFSKLQYWQVISFYNYLYSKFIFPNSNLLLSQPSPIYVKINVLVVFFFLRPCVLRAGSWLWSLYRLIQFFTWMILKGANSPWTDSLLSLLSSASLLYSPSAVWWPNKVKEHNSFWLPCVSSHFMSLLETIFAGKWSLRFQPDITADVT